MRQRVPSPDHGGSTAVIGSAAAGAGALLPGAEARYDKAGGRTGGGHSIRNRRQT
jgi:hypothetical protein